MPGSQLSLSLSLHIYSDVKVSKSIILQFNVAPSGWSGWWSVIGEKGRCWTEGSERLKNCSERRSWELNSQSEANCSQTGSWGILIPLPSSFIIVAPAPGFGANLAEHPAAGELTLPGVLGKLLRIVAHLMVQLNMLGRMFMSIERERIQICTWH